MAPEQLIWCAREGHWCYSNSSFICAGIKETRQKVHEYFIMCCFWVVVAWPFHPSVTLITHTSDWVTFSFLEIETWLRPLSSIHRANCSQPSFSMRFHLDVSYQALKLKCDVKGLGTGALLPGFKSCIALWFQFPFLSLRPCTQPQAGSSSTWCVQLSCVAFYCPWKVSRIDECCFQA